MTPDRTDRDVVLIVSAFDSPAIAEDAEILSASYSVRRAAGNGPAALLRAASGVFSCDIVYCWFLSVYGAVAILLGSVLGRRTVVVIGGVDVARDAESGYGLWLSPWKAFLARRALRRADLVLAVAESLRDDAVRLAQYDGANIRVLPTGYDPGFWSPGGPRSTDVLCVAAVGDRARLSIKGIDVLVDAARRMPGAGVTILGVDPRFIPELDPPPNVSFLPHVPRAELLAVYRSARVYCQPSMREGLPGALCEAMLCGCYPVVTAAGGMTLAVGDAGIVVRPGDAAALAGALLKALSIPDQVQNAGRSRIAGLFPFERRKTELTGLLDSLSNSVNR
jgi:glycosyltransferase involved in cell wall biosynthesis